MKRTASSLILIVVFGLLPGPAAGQRVEISPLAVNRSSLAQQIKGLKKTDPKLLRMNLFSRWKNSYLIAYKPPCLR